MGRQNIVRRAARLKAASDAGRPDPANMARSLWDEDQLALSEALIEASSVEVRPGNREFLRRQLEQVFDAEVLAASAPPSIPDGDSPHGDIVYPADAGEDVEATPPPSPPPPSPDLSVALGRSKVGLELMELVLPKRLAMEDLGDAMEQIARLVQRREPTWKVYLKTASTMFWLAVKALREIISALPGKKAGS